MTEILDRLLVWMPKPLKAYLAANYKAQGYRSMTEMVVGLIEADRKHREGWEAPEPEVVA